MMLVRGSSAMGRPLFLCQLCLVFTTALAPSDATAHELPPLPPPEEASVGVQYRGAATQFAPYSEWGDGGGKEILDTNFFTMMQLAQQAAQQRADVIVFPEYGITGTNLGGNRSQLRELCQVVPHPGDGRTPCGEDITHDNYRMVQALSCLAMELDMYVVVDLAELSIADVLQARLHLINSSSTTAADSKKDLPDEGSKNTQTTDESFVAYNSQVVFDRTGAVVARYRKKHLFLEPAFAFGIESDETALFNTDFGATFSLQVCFDIMYQSPALTNVVAVGVRDVAMSTAWIDELPFLTAPQIFSSWSKGLKVNLIASNLYMPSGGELGSGIFHASHLRNPTYTYDAALSDPVVMVDDVSTTVSGDMMTDFNESQDNVIKKLVKGLIRGLKLVDSSVNDHNENDSAFLGDDITYENVGRKVEEFIESVKHRSRSEEKVEQVLRKLLSDQRRIVEWDRYRNRLACSTVCQHVRHLLQQSRQTHFNISDKKENSHKYVASSDAFNDSNSKSDIINSLNSISDSVSETYQFIIHENISFYSHQALEMNESHFPNRTQRARCCHLDTFCCEVEYLHPREDNPAGPFNYTLLAYNGTVAKGSGVYEMWTQVCAVVFCTGNGISSCAPLNAPQPEFNTSFKLRNIRGQFDTKFIYPSVFSHNFSLVDNELWSYADSSNKTDWSSALLIDGDVPNLLTAAMFARWYSLDP